MQDAISAPAVGGIVRLTRFILGERSSVELLVRLRCCRCSAGTMAAGHVDGSFSFRFRLLQCGL